MAERCMAEKTDIWRQPPGQLLAELIALNGNEVEQAMLLHHYLARLLEGCYRGTELPMHRVMDVLLITLAGVIEAVWTTPETRAEICQIFMRNLTLALAIEPSEDRHDG